MNYGIVDKIRVELSKSLNSLESKIFVGLLLLLLLILILALVTFCCSR